MTSHILAPVKGFTGNVVGVDFKDGVGHTDDPAAYSYFERQSYAISTPCLPGCDFAEQPDDGKDLTPKQKLQAEAKELGLDEAGTVDELKARIAEHKTNDETPPAGDAGKTDDGKGAVSNGQVL